MASLTLTESMLDSSSSDSSFSFTASSPPSDTSTPSDTPQSAIPATFHQFPALPCDVRGMIWRFAFLDILQTQPPRLIEVRAHTQKNLFWDIDCDEIPFPKPTGSTVVGWTEVNPRGPSTLENVCRESRKIIKSDDVQNMWDYCFNDTHANDLRIIEVFEGENGMEDTRYVDMKVGGERLGFDFERGIKFLSDRDTIYLKTMDGEIMRALLDSKASTLNLQSVKKMAMEMPWNGHYLLEKQLFNGWHMGDEEDSEEPMLMGLKELTMIMKKKPQDKWLSGIKGISCQQFTLADEALSTNKHAILERFKQYEVFSSKNVKVELVERKNRSLLHGMEGVNNAMSSVIIREEL